MSSILLKYCRSPVNVNSLSLRCFMNSLKTSAITRSDAKTPVQKWGWEYLLRQEKLKRPLAPHLGIYQPQLTWGLSGFHRISGTVMGSAVAVLAVGMLVLPYNFTEVIEWIRSLNIPRPIVYALKWLIAFSLSFHAFNGVRFLGFDVAYGMDLASVYRSGYIVTALALAFATAVAFYSTDLNAVKAELKHKA